MKVKIVLILMMLTVIFAYAKEPGNEQNIVMPLGEGEWPVAFVFENNTDLALAENTHASNEKPKQAETAKTQVVTDVNPEVNVQFHVEVGEITKSKTSRYIPPYKAKGEEFLPVKTMYNVEVVDTAISKPKTSRYIPPYKAKKEYLPIKVLYHVEVGDTAKPKTRRYIPPYNRQKIDTIPIKVKRHVVVKKGNSRK